MAGGRGPFRWIKPRVEAEKAACGDKGVKPKAPSSAMIFLRSAKCVTVRLASARDARSLRHGMTPNHPTGGLL